MVPEAVLMLAVLFTTAQGKCGSTVWWTTHQSHASLRVLQCDPGVSEIHISDMKTAKIIC